MQKPPLDEVPVKTRTEETAEVCRRCAGSAFQVDRRDLKHVTLSCGARRATFSGRLPAQTRRRADRRPRVPRWKIGLQRRRDGWDERLQTAVDVGLRFTGKLSGRQSH